MTASVIGLPWIIFQISACRSKAGGASKLNSSPIFQPITETPQFPEKTYARSRKLFGLCRGTRWGGRSAGINRHAIGNERVLQERSSESILTPSLAWRIVRCGPKHRQGQRRAGY